MKKLFLLITLASIIFSSCKNDKSNAEYLNDFEAIGHWTNNQNITRETASSGLFCTVTDTSIPYTQTMKLNWSDLKVENPKSAIIIAWVLVRDLKAKGKLVFSMDSNEKNIMWIGEEVQQRVKEINKWTEVKFKIDLSKKIPADASIKIYGVNDGEYRIYWDDFLLTFNK
ncbi:MAG: hypothetical protein IPO63_16305 [Bacteroidetes bacterium]|nr:hypothetical protein [Bacteroidota bacterium]